MDGSINRSIDRSINQSINQSVNQPIKLKLSKIIMMLILVFHPSTKFLVYKMINSLLIFFCVLNIISTSANFKIRLLTGLTLLISLKRIEKQNILLPKGSINCLPILRSGDLIFDLHEWSYKLYIILLLTACLCT